jgi:ABC-type glycerol-3-phosphate transport system substrate-binding protein
MTEARSEDPDKVADQVVVDAARARLDALRAEYAPLLGMTVRTPEQELRYQELARELERSPRPWLSDEENLALLASMDRTEDMMVEAMRGGMTPQQLMDAAERASRRSDRR